MSHFCYEYDDITCSISTLCMVSVIFSGIGGSSNSPTIRKLVLKAGPCVHRNFPEQEQDLRNF